MTQANGESPHYAPDPAALAESLAQSKRTLDRERNLRKTAPSRANTPKPDHPHRATRRSTKRNPQLNPELSVTVLLPGTNPIPWTGLEPPEILRLSRPVEPCRYLADGTRVEPTFETVSFVRASIVDGCHSYRELS